MYQFKTKIRANGKFGNEIASTRIVCVCALGKWGEKKVSVWRAKRLYTHRKREKERERQIQTQTHTHILKFHVKNALSAYVYYMKHYILHSKNQVNKH